MLSQSTVVAAAALADSLAARSLTLQARPNTVISELNRATNAAALDAVALPDIDKWENFDAAAYGGFIEHITFNLDNPTQHDLVIQNYTDDLRQAVLSHIQFARNIVKPVVIDFAERLQQHLQNTMVPTAEDQFTVTVFEVPEPLSDIVFTESLNRYRNTPLHPPQAKMQLKAFGDESLLPYLLTGEDEVDRQIADWYGRTQKDNYTEMFLDVTNPTIVVQPVSLARQVNRWLFSYLLSNALYNKADMFDDTTSLSLSTHKSVAANYRDYSGAMLVKALDHLAMLNKNNVLVMEALASVKSITVNGDVYRAWLADGGCTEVLFALLITNAPYKTAAQIQPHLERLNREWTSYKLFWSNSQSNRRLSIVKESARLIFRETMTHLSEDEQEYVKTHNDYMGNVDRLLSKFTENLKLSDLNDIYALALKLVCNCRFYYTDAECILSEIEEISKQNPDIDVREAALIATIHYLVDFMCDQLLLTSKV